MHSKYILEKRRKEIKAFNISNGVDVLIDGYENRYRWRDIYISIKEQYDSNVIITYKQIEHLKKYQKT